MVVKEVKCKECGTVHKDVILSVSYDVTGNGDDTEMFVWQCQLKKCKVRNVYVEEEVEVLTPAQKVAITRAKNKEILESIDTDGNGRITQKEAIEAVKKVKK